MSQESHKPVLSREVHLSESEVVVEVSWQSSVKCWAGNKRARGGSMYLPRLVVWG